MLNPYSPTSNTDSGRRSTYDRFPGPSVLDVLQTVWIASGLSVFGLIIVSAFTVEKSVSGLLVSDDSYVASFVASVPVSVFFAIGGAVGWWFRSKRIASIATLVPLICCAALLWTLDWVHDFGEGEDLIGYLAIGILLGGACGSIALYVHNSYARLALSIAPHLMIVLGYLTVIASMSR